MTVSTTTYFVNALGNGATTVFSFPFIADSASTIQVTYTNVSGVATVLSPSLYTLLINPVSVGNLWGIGGTVTYPLSGSPIPTGSTLTIQRIVPYTQSVSISNQGAFYPQAIEQGLDILELQIQQLTGVESLDVRAPLSDGPIDMTLPAKAARASTYLGFDGNGLPVAVPGSNILPIDLSNFTATATGGSASRSLANYFNDLINVKDFGAIGNGVANDTTAINNAITYVNSITSGTGGTVASGPTLYFPRGTYLITSGFTLPARSICEGTFSGNFTILFTQRKEGFAQGFNCYTFKVSGAWHCRISNIVCSSQFLIDAHDPAWGTYWNTFEQINTPQMALDTSVGSVNENTFIACGSGGTCRFDISGSYGGNGNLFISCDFTSATGFIDSSTPQYLSIAEGVYLDQGTENLTGSIDVYGLVSNGQSLPAQTRRNHLLSNSNVNGRVDMDFLSLGTQNRVQGGSWNIRDSSGKPPSFTGTGAAFQVDAAEPTGVGGGWGNIASTITREVSVAITLVPQISVQAFAAVLYIPQGLDYCYVQFNANPATNLFYSNITFTGLGSGWNLARFSLSGFTGAISSAKVVFGINGTVGTPKSLTVSSVFSSSEKAAPMPSASTDVINYGVATSGGYCVDVNNMRMQFGKVAQGPVAAPPTVAIAVTFPKSYAANPVVTVTLETDDPTSANMTKIWVNTITTTGFICTVTYATSFRGVINWTAMGNLS